MVTAFLYIAHGTQKLVGFPAAEPRPGVPLVSLLGLASGLEIIGGTLLLVGLFTRPIAFLLSGEMAVAYFTSWAPRGFWRSFQAAGMEASILFCFLFLFFWAAGPGAWSLDAWRGRKR